MRLSGTKANSIHQYRGLGNQLWDLGGLLPSLDLNFAYTKNLVDGVTGKSLVTFTRASSATYIDSAGVLQTAATDVPRFDHDPVTRASLGLLVEEQRTNSIRNNTIVGAVAGTPGTMPTNWFASSTATGVTRSVIGTGTENGIAYIDIRFNGTATTAGNLQAGFEPVNQIAAVSGQTWSLSTYWKIVAGGLTGLSGSRIFINEYSAASAYLVSQVVTVSVPTSNALSTQRVTGAMTTANASTAFVQPCIGFDIANGAVVDITLRIGLPQVEQGAFATSVIPTTTAAVTRSADVASITGSNFSSWYRQDEGTVFADINSAPVNNTPQVAFDISEGVGNERIFMRRTASAFAGFALVDNGVTQADVGSVNTVAASSRYLAAGAYRLNSVHIGINGQLGSAEDTAATIPTVDRLFIGQNFGSGQHVNGSIRRLTYWPTRLANSTLQAITQ